MRLCLMLVAICLLPACDKKSESSQEGYSYTPSYRPPTLVVTTIVDLPASPSQPTVASSSVPQDQPVEQRSAEDQAMIDLVMEERAKGFPLNNCPDDPCPVNVHPPVTDELPAVQMPQVDPSIAQRLDLQRQIQLQRMRAIQQQSADNAFEMQIRMQCHSTCRMYPNGDMMGCIRDCDRR